MNRSTALFGSLLGSALSLSAANADALLSTPASLLPVSRISALRAGGGAVGNGGGAMVCRNASGAIERVEVLDFFEARKIRGIPIDLGNVPGAWKAKAQYAVDRLGRLSELRRQLYSFWLRTFENEAMILEGMEFNPVSDAMGIGVEKGCAFEQAAVQIIPRFPGDHRYYLNADLWNAMDDTQKAGLVFHEMVYREALSYGHADSVAARYLVALANSPQINAMDFDGFLKILDRTHFEVTDFPAPRRTNGASLGIETEFSPANLWRFDPSNPPPTWSRFRFPDRFVANVGYCRNEGCSDWRSFLRERPRTICFGTVRFNFAGGETIGLEDASYSALHPVEGRCARKVQVDGATEADSATLTFLDDAPPGGPLDPSLTVPPSQSVSEATFAWHAGGRYRLLAVRARKFASAYASFEIAAPSPVGCAFEIRGWDDQGIGAWADLSQPAKECVGKIAAKMPGYELNLVIRGDLPGDSTVAFEADGSFRPRTNASVAYLRAAARGDGEFGCIKGQSDLYPCVSILEMDAARIRALRVEGGGLARFRIEYLDAAGNPAQDAQCEVADGIYELHPNRLVPKMLVLRESCTLLFSQSQAPNEYRTYSAGAILRLDASGRVTEQLK